MFTIVALSNTQSYPVDHQEHVNMYTYREIKEYSLSIIILVPHYLNFFVVELAI